MLDKLLPKKLLYILLLALLLRGVIVAINLPELSSAVTGDTDSYLDFAKAVGEGDFWRYPSANRTPIYPLFLAIFHGDLLGSIIGQIFVSLISIVITYHLAQELFENKNLALISSLLLAVSQESITHSYYLLTETLFTCLFVAAIYFLILSKKTNKRVYIAISSMLMSLAALARPIVVLFPVVMLFFLFIEKQTWRRKITNAMLYAGVAALFLGGWTIRNVVVVNIPSVSSVSARSLLYYNAASLRAKQTGRLESDIRQELSDEVFAILEERGLPDTEANQTIVANELGKSIILSTPVEYAILHLKNDINSLLPDTDILEVLGFPVGQSGTLDYLKQNGLIAGIKYYFNGDYFLILILVPFILILGIEYAGAAIGIVYLTKRKEFYNLLILGMPIAYGLILAGSAANPRFRVPIMPYLVILAAYGIDLVFQKRRVPAQELE